MEFPAHIRESAEGKEIQTAAAHSRSASEYAGECLHDIGLAQAGMLAGLIHDCGKFKAEFARYLEDPNAPRGTVNHTFAGFRLLMERCHADAAQSMEDLTAELLAFAIGSHHGSFDCVDENRKSGILHRMTKPDIVYEESIQNFQEQCASGEELDERFAKAHTELTAVYEKPETLTEDPEERAFHIGLLAVMEKAERDTYDSNDSREPNAIRMQSIFCQRPLYAANQLEKQLERAYFPRLKSGSRIWYKNLIGQIMEAISAFPEGEWNKPLDDSYLMGYYLQRSALYTKKNDINTEETNNEQTDE